MEKLLGVDFERIGDTLISPDGRLSVTGTDQPEQGFHFGVLDLKPYAAFFEKFNCVTLGISPVAEAAVFDLDAVLHDERITSLHIDADGPVIPTRFTPGRTYFSNLTRLHILGACPSEFPDLRELDALRKLTIQYDKHFTSVWNACESVKDLVVHDYDEKDLVPLGGMVGIERLTITRGKLTSLKGIEQFPRLKTLILTRTPKLTDLEPLLSAPLLRNIKFESYRKTTEWNFLAARSDWEAIILDTASTIDFVQDIHSLNYFYCGKVQDCANKYTALVREDGAKELVPDRDETASFPIYAAFYESI